MDPALTVEFISFTLDPHYKLFVTVFQQLPEEYMLQDPLFQESKRTNWFASF